MKKIIDVIKPFISIVFGALIILLYLNDISAGGVASARSVFAFLVGSYFIVVGLLGLICPLQIGERVLRLLNAIGVSVFASFFFMITVLNIADFNDMYGVNGWIIADFQLSAAIGFAVLFLITLFVKNGVLCRICNLFGMLFLLALLLELLFTPVGNPATINDFPIVKLVVNLSFAYIYLAVLKE